MIKRLGAQLYTVRDYVKTPEEFDVTIRRIKEMGYTTVQASALWHLPVDEVASIVHSHGLSIVLTHMGYDRFTNDLDALIKDHHTLGCKLAGLGGLPKQFWSEEGYKAFAKQFREIADELDQNGLKFSYHNHNFEFERFQGKTGMEILMENTNPETFLFTLDTYWVQAGGGNPAAWIRKLNGRIEAIHFKDMTIIDAEPVMAEVMEGNLEWTDILHACEEAGVEWYLIERDAGPCEAFESLRISYSNLSKVGFA
ncbi:sugar phosphate isomerase/epimerase [Paenibacillus cellulosilyticus]|uniref:Sugar phosphate isomerase/epimerase n=1 Tax=Paenibacillus cellulosilyticus TaxID=375489 RepID=A0A2V2YC77_9BACL|nr:sugar phosphate isomerase/epimerase [Paenibacillus cellulosilyticus]PWV89429.1 sugar phosphate isomerase/epimerase [Paenibacillus cellulosilyticus]QKS47281.1 sugar phosphate isomerase/epimerase [Paenibacillus cellulosilyticus]